MMMIGGGFYIVITKNYYRYFSWLLFHKRPGVSAYGMQQEKKKAGRQLEQENQVQPL